LTEKVDLHDTDTLYHVFTANLINLGTRRIKFSTQGQLQFLKHPNREPNWGTDILFSYVQKRCALQRWNNYTKITEMEQ